MNKNALMIATVIIVSSLSGCFVEPGREVSLEFDGHSKVSDGEFNMTGQVRLSGGIPTKDVYRDIHLELYAENGSLLYKDKLGTLHNRSERLDVSVSLSKVPYYVIFDSQDFWDANSGVPYYVRSESGYQGYQARDTNDRRELPTTPVG